MNADDARQRLAKALLALLPRSEGQRLPGPGTTSIGLTQAEIAQLIGTARETVERTLSEWRARGIIFTEYRSIYVSRPDELRRLARFDDANRPTVDSIPA